jgi:hypothetical protein
MDLSAGSEIIYLAMETRSARTESAKNSIEAKIKKLMESADFKTYQKAIEYNKKSKNSE